MTPTGRSVPRYIPQHGNRHQGSVPYGRRHHRPSRPPRSGAPHSHGTTTVQHRQTTSPVGETRRTRLKARGPKRPGLDRALLHITMKNTALLPTTLAEEKHFIVEGLTDDVITLATNTLAATTDAWDDAVGQPTARKDRVQETEDTLTPDLVDHLEQLTSPPDQHNRKTEGLKVTDWTILDRPPDAPKVTLTCHQHTWWVAQWDTTGTTERVHTFTPETRTATPLALGDRFSHSTHHTDHPLAHWLALKTAMHWTVDAPTTDNTLPATWLTLTRNLTAFIRKHGTSQAERWMSWPTNTEQTLEHGTTNLQEQANKLRAMHRPCEGQGPTYSIFHKFHNRNAPKPAPKTGARTSPARTKALS